MSSSTIVKQLTINRLNLPSEILDIIKGYSMYDIPTWLALLQPVKNIKNEIFQLITNSISRANPLFDTDDGWIENWNFYMGYDLAIVFDAKNCKKCGNYKESTIFNHIQLHTKCNCVYKFRLSGGGVLTLNND